MTVSTSALEEILRGLQSRPRSLSPKFLYDEHGSRIFEEICELEEYYPTRTERRILEQVSSAIAQILGPGVTLIEPGSGNCRKVRLLLQDLKPSAYIPIEIDREMLLESARSLQREFPWLSVRPVHADYTGNFLLPWTDPESPKVIFFPGSTLGNFEPGSAQRFLRRLAETAGRTGRMLIGIDTRKDPRILLRAYADPKGVTARFNLNLLTRLNREFGSDFDVDAFEHRAIYDEKRGRIEMHLVSRRKQTAQLGGERFRFRAGDTIHTESSYKYSAQEFHRLVEGADLKVSRTWNDPQDWFQVHLLTHRF